MPVVLIRAHSDECAFLRLLNLSAEWWATIFSRRGEELKDWIGTNYSLFHDISRFLCSNPDPGRAIHTTYTLLML